MVAHDKIVLWNIWTFQETDQVQSLDLLITWTHLVNPIDSEPRKFYCIS
jgi:hypothetical protein